jgi:hypothetical protein
MFRFNRSINRHHCCRLIIVSVASPECSVCTCVTDLMYRNAKQTVLLDGIPHLYLNYSKHNYINMNKITSSQPMIHRRHVGCLFIGNTSCSACSQQCELHEMSPLSALKVTFLLYKLSNARTWRDVHCKVPVSANTVINKQCGAEFIRIMRLRGKG